MDNVLNDTVSAIIGSMQEWVQDKDEGPETEKGKATRALAEKFYLDNIAGKESLYTFIAAIGVLIGILAKNLVDLPANTKTPEGPVN